MKRFSFRLARVLEVRIAEEKEQARRVAYASQAVEVARAQLLEHRARQAAAEQHVTRHCGETTNAGTLAMLGDALHVARRRAKGSATAHRDALAALEEERRKLGEAMKVRRSLERLRDYQQVEWEVDLGRRERGEMDEIAARREQRRMGQSP